MTESTIFNILLIAWFGVASAVFISLFFISAAYGRHISGGWGITIKSKLGWIVMESASPMVFAACYVLGDYKFGVTAWTFLMLWLAHYLHRAFIYPMQRRDGDKRIPLAVVCPGLIFNSVNGYLNGRYIYTLSGGYTSEWISDPRFIAGLVIFLIGFTINRHADATLSKLRRANHSEYLIPQGLVYRYISCPNYLGEILIWSGWAIATWSFAGLSFAFWTASNLVPRARAHHRWYLSNLPEYPTKRKALIPGIW